MTSSELPETMQAVVRHDHKLATTPVGQLP
jgi:hypothetical protein